MAAENASSNLVSADQGSAARSIVRREVVHATVGLVDVSAHRAALDQAVDEGRHSGRGDSEVLPQLAGTRTGIVGDEQQGAGVEFVDLEFASRDLQCRGPGLDVALQRSGEGGHATGGAVHPVILPHGDAV